MTLTVSGGALTVTAGALGFFDGTQVVPLSTGGPKVTVPPAGRTLFGAIVDTTTGLHGEAGIEQRETDTGRPYDLHLQYYGWAESFNFAAGSQAASDAAHGRIPQISWGYGDMDLAGINAGSDDAFIAQQAVRCRDYGRPIFLRLGIEMNAQVGASYQLQPTGYIAAWQRVRGIFDRYGATNVSWVWCPNIDSKGGVYGWDDYYPGDAYVDWIGVDGYNTAVYGDPNRTFAAIFSPFLSHFSGRKPIMIGEFATDSSFGAGTASAWIADMGQWVEDNADTYGLKAICWFDVNTSTSGIDYRVDQTADAYTEWTNAITRTIFGGPGYEPPSDTTAYSTAVLADTPAAYWRFDETAGLVAADASGNGHSGSLAGPPTINQPSHAGLRTAYAFPGGSAHVTADTLGSWGAGLSAGFTVELWINTTSTANACVLGFLNTGTATGLGVYANTAHGLGASAGLTTFWLRSETGQQRITEINTGIYDGAWHHIVWVCNATSSGVDTIYVDGAAVTPTYNLDPVISSTADLGFPLMIGGRNNRGSVDQAYIGSLDEVALYPAKLTAARVTAHYSAAA